MREFIKSLSKKQQLQFVEIVNNKSRMLPAIAAAIEEHLSGKSDDYNQFFGSSEERKSVSNKAPEADMSGVDAYVSEYTKKKMEAFEAESRAASIKINGYQ